VATSAEAGTDSAPVQVATSFDAFLIAFEAAFEWVHKYPSLFHEDKKERDPEISPRVSSL